MNPKVVFYDVEPDAWDAWLYKLASAAWERGNARLMILVDGPERAERLDGMLWSFREEAFVPHEVVRDGEPLADADARVLISWKATNPHGATLLALDSPADLDFAASFDVVMDVIGTLGWSEAKPLLAQGGRLLLVTAGLWPMLGAFLRPSRAGRRLIAGTSTEAKDQMAKLNNDRMNATMERMKVTKLDTKYQEQKP